jgi:hypothetical protein
MLKILNRLSYHHLLIVLLALGSTACGGATQPQAQSLGTFSEQVSQFVSDAKTYGKSVDTSHLVIQEESLGNGSSTTTLVDGWTETTTDTDVGLCQFLEAGPVVTISSYAAQNFDAETLLTLVYHELGHCLLFLDHDSTLGTDGTPASLMYPGGVSGEVFLSNKAAYLEQLFSQQADSAFQGGT